MLELPKGISGFPEDFRGGGIVGTAAFQISVGAEEGIRSVFEIGSPVLRADQGQFLAGKIAPAMEDLPFHVGKHRVDVGHHALDVGENVRVDPLKNVAFLPSIFLTEGQNEGVVDVPVVVFFDGKELSFKREAGNRGEKLVLGQWFHIALIIAFFGYLFIAFYVLFKTNGILAFW